METANYVYYQDGEFWIGWFEEYPDYRTQGMSLEELQGNLRDIYGDLMSGAIPAVRHVGQLAIK